MLKRFEVENFKNFDNRVVLDFTKVANCDFNMDCIHNDLIGMGMIYGANAVGKSNFCRAIMDITWVVSQVRRIINYNVTNANSDKEKAQFLYKFCFGKDDIIYEYSRDSRYLLVNEKMIINDVIIFDFDYISNKFIDMDLQAIGAETIQVNKYLDFNNDNSNKNNPEETIQIPFLRYLLTNASISQGSPIRKLETFVDNMRSVGFEGFSSKVNQAMFDNFLDFLGTKGELKKFNTFLNKYGVNCKLKIEKQIDGKNQLFFNFRKPISFIDNASSGTLSLTKLYMWLFRKETYDSFIYLDEFDAFYHYELAEQIVKLIKENFKNTQVIFTTHNTNLMSNQLMRPDCLFILSRDGRLTPLCDATERELKEGHNLEKLYIGGEFRKYE